MGPAGTLLVVTLLFAPSLAQGTGVGVGSIPVFFLNGHPARGGRVIAVTRLDASSASALHSATHVDLRVGAHGYAFAVAVPASRRDAIGATVVAVTAGTKTLFDAAAQLHAALTGDAKLVVFLDAPPGGGVVTGMLPVRRVSAGSRVEAQGATHLVILAGGREVPFTIVNAGSTLGDVLVTEGITGAKAGTKGLLEVIEAMRI